MVGSSSHLELLLKDLRVRYHADHTVLLALLGTVHRLLLVMILLTGLLAAPVCPDTPPR